MEKKDRQVSTSPHIELSVKLCSRAGEVNQIDCKVAWHILCEPVQILQRDKEATGEGVKRAVGYRSGNRDFMYEQEPKL